MDILNQIGGIGVLLSLLEGSIPDLKSKILGFIEQVTIGRNLEESKGHVIIQVYIKDDTICFDIAQKHGFTVDKVCNIVTLGIDLFPPVFAFFEKLQKDKVPTGKLSVECLKLIRFHPKDVNKTKPQTFLIVAFTPLDDTGKCLKPINTMSIEKFVKTFIESIKDNKENGKQEIGC